MVTFFVGQRAKHLKVRANSANSIENVENVTHARSKLLFHSVIISHEATVVHIAAKLVLFE